MLPEDYNEAGALWEHLTRQRRLVLQLRVRHGDAGEASREQMHKETGIRMAVSFPLPKPLFDHTSRNYPTYNMAIPDQYRMDMFEQELRERWESGKEPFPQLVTMVLPQDHMTNEHPGRRLSVRESYMADNDLALGRVMQTLSHSRWWQEMLVIVAEDDPQGGRDHVDAHRSLLMFVGPHVRRGYVSHDAREHRVDHAVDLHAARACRRSTSSTRTATLSPTSLRDTPNAQPTAPGPSTSACSIRTSALQAVRSPLQLEGPRRIAGDGRSRRHARDLPRQRRQ